MGDLVVVDAGPLADIHNIRQTRMVMKEGHVFDPATLPKERVLWPAAGERSRSAQ